MDKFELVSPYKPSGDQPQAIDKLVEGIKKGYRDQTLLGVTGSGKTFTMANIIARMNRPTLILAHNKILAAQLCSEFKEFFPHNAVEYFVSYYDYYQPEAYIPSTDAYIEKDSAINDEIDKLRHSATLALAERRLHVAAQRPARTGRAGELVQACEVIEVETQVHGQLQRSRSDGVERDRDLGNARAVRNGIVDVLHHRHRRRRDHYYNSSNMDSNFLFFPKVLISILSNSPKT